MSTTNQPGDIDLIFLGTGTSGSVPNIACLTAPPTTPRCRTCTSAITPSGRKNARRNTSAIVRVPGRDGRPRTLLIDAGKNLQAAALEWFPAHGLRALDGVLITHAHADAMNGLDDLRAWTLRGVIQAAVPIYCSRATFADVARAFPYMVAKEHASGGGDVPEFTWHIFEDGVPFEIEDTGIEVLPVPVHHGRYFPAASPAPKAHGHGQLPTPDGTHPSTPAQRLSPPPSPSPTTPDPYICHAFLIQRTVLYMADVSHVPESAWSLIEAAVPPASGNLSVAVLDCLRPLPHTSHFGIAQAVGAARRLQARRTYITGMGHDMSHEEYVRVGEILGGARVEDVHQGEEMNKSGAEELTPDERRCLDLIDNGSPLWLRPAHDGLRVVVDRGAGVVCDGTYDS